MPCGARRFTATLQGLARETALWLFLQSTKHGFSEARRKLALQQGLLLIASDARPSLSSFIAACAVQSWEHRPGAMHVPACVLMAARLDQNLHLSLLLDYCHHREPKDLKDTKTVTLRTLFFDILPRGSQSQGAGSSPRENSADGRQREPCRDHSLSRLCSATVHWVFFLFV